MFPTTGTITLVAFATVTVHRAQGWGIFWNQSVYGVSLHGLEDTALTNCLRSRLLVTSSPKFLLTGPGQSAKHLIDFSTLLKVPENCELPFSWKIVRIELMHGYACWFDVKFFGSLCSISDDISSCSGHALVPIAATFQRAYCGQCRQVVSGNINFKANAHQFCCHSHMG